MRKRRPWFRKAPPFSIEFLEDRVTPAAMFELWDGTLTVSGTDRGDSIRVSLQLPTLAVTMNDAVRSFSASQILRLHIYAQAGNDTVSVAPSVLFGALIFGGAGDDFIQSGAGNDVIGGGIGDDTIFGGAGDDELNGDASPAQQTSDLPVGPQANASAPASIEAPSAVASSVANESGATAVGSPGNDQLFGEAGNDTVRGGGGNDIIVGGMGNDQLYGEAGNDIVDGGAGDDLIDGGSGADRLRPGSGADRINSDASDTVDVRFAVVTRVSAQAAAGPAELVRTADDLFDADHAQTPADTAGNQTQGGDANHDTDTTTARGEPSDGLAAVAVPFSSDVVVAPQTVAGASAVSASDETTGTEENSSLVRLPAADTAISQQVDWLLQGAVLSEATSDGPDRADFISPKRGRRRPTFLYIKPIPLPDLIPDIELPMP